MIGFDLLPVALRALTYIGSIAAAGGILFTVGFPSAAVAIRNDLERQIIFGCGLLLLIEPLRYAAFQLSIAEGDLSLAFGPDLRWMGMQTPMGQAAAMRFIAALAILTLALRSVAARTAAALVMIVSFAVEGHTASSEARTAASTGALLVHVAAVHWWLGALYPLLVLTAEAPPATLASTVEAFGRRAVWLVGGLLAAGVMLFVFLTGGLINIENPYQQRFLLKLALVVGLLATAAWNKLRLTPLLRRDHDTGRAELSASIKLEMLVALSILLATAWAINSSPDS
jgi:putative copper export protein